MKTFTRQSGLLAILLFLFLPVHPVLAQTPPPNDVIVELKDGGRIHGRLTAENDDSIVVVSPILGSLTLAREDVVSVTVVSKGEDSEKAAAAKKKADAEEKAKEKAKEKEKEKEEEKAKEKAKEKGPWSGSVNLGLTYSEASKRSSSLNISGAIKKETEEAKFALNAKYFYSVNGGVVSDNDVFVNADQTWLINRSRWSIFAMATYQWDEFQLWEHRFSPYAGVGYLLVKKKDLDLTLRLGAGGTWEYTDKDFEPQFLIELKTDWEISSLQSLEGSARIAPKMNDFSNYLMTLSLNYKLKLAEDSPFSLNLSVLDIYDSQPEGGGTNNDLKLVLSLGYDF